MNVKLFVFVLLTSCSPIPREQAQKRSEPQPPSTVKYGDPKVHADDPNNPWTIDKLPAVEKDVAPGQRQQISTFEIPKDAKESIIEGEVTYSLQNVDLFIIPKEEGAKLKSDPSYSPKQMKTLGRPLRFHFPVIVGAQYAVWLWNKDAEKSNHIKLELKRHYR